MKNWHVVLVCLIFALPATLLAADWPTAEPEDVGMSSERLARISPIMKQFVDAKKFPCAVTLVARKGKIVFFDMYGYQDVEQEIPVRDDTIFRMFSQGKPIVGVAVMILYEEGKFLLDDPIAEYLPEFSDMKVLVHEDTGETEDASPITVKHLLTHTAGLSYTINRVADPVGQLYREAGLVASAHFTDAESLNEWTKRISEMPLAAQPGTEWRYSVAMDVLARLVEVWSGKPFDTFLRDRLFRPLDMRDTGFFVPDAKHDRLSMLYRIDADGQRARTERWANEFRKPPRFAMCGGAIVSTPRDYFRFAQMLLNGGELDGVRVLGPRTVDLMTRDHLPYSMGANPVWGTSNGKTNPLDRTLGFGFTGSVTVEPLVGRVIDFGWAGAAGTFFWICPEDQVAVLFFSQAMGTRHTIGKRLKVLVNQAIIE